MKYLFIYLLIINAIGWLIMLIDKQKAKKGQWRISEATLMTVAAIGGSLGSLIGMYQFRHKTKHTKFVVGIPLMMFLHVALLMFLYKTI